MLLCSIAFQGTSFNTVFFLASNLPPYRFSGFTLLFFLSFGAFYLWNLFTFVIGIQRLLDMYRFYTYLLDIPDVSLPLRGLYTRSTNAEPIG